MQHRFYYAIGLMLALALCAMAAEQGQQPGADQMQQMMEQYAKAGEPGPEHALLAKMAGTWKSNTRMFMSPDAPPMEAPEGVHTGEMVLGGRFLYITERGDMMGMPMEGLGFIGFNKASALYQLVWMDNTATMMYTASGTADAAGKVITLHGRIDDPVRNIRDKGVKYVYRFEAPDRIVFEIWDSMENGQFFLSVETTYTK